MLGFSKHFSLYLLECAQHKTLPDNKGDLSNVQQFMSVNSLVQSIITWNNFRLFANFTQITNFILMISIIIYLDKIGCLFQWQHKRSNTSMQRRISKIVFNTKQRLESAEKQFDIKLSEYYPGYGGPKHKQLILWSQRTISRDCVLWF